MNFTLSFPSLQRLTMIQVGSNLLNQRLVANEKVDKPHSVKISRLPEEFENWFILKGKLSVTLDNLPLPESLRAQLWDIIEQLYFQIWSWVEYCNCDELSFVNFKMLENNVMRKFCFNVQGEISRKKMLETYIERIWQCAHFSIIMCYNFACEWCLEDYIIEIWDLMDEDDRHKVRAMNNENPLLAYWTINVGEGNDRINIFNLYHHDLYNPDNSIFENLLSYALNTHKKISVEYLWHKLTDVEKARKAKECAKFAIKYKIRNLMCYALTHMSKRNQTEIFLQHSRRILSCFLLWPYDEFFFPTLEVTWDYVSVREFLSLFEIIVQKMQEDLNDRFHDILLEFWIKSPVLLKRSVIGGSKAAKYFSHMVQVVKHLNQGTYNMLTRDMEQLSGSSAVE